MPSSPVTTAANSTRRPRRGRIAAALAAGIITVVVGSLDTATAQTPDDDRQSARSRSATSAGVPPEEG